MRRAQLRVRLVWSGTVARAVWERIGKRNQRCRSEWRRKGPGQGARKKSKNHSNWRLGIHGRKAGWEEPRVGAGQRRGEGIEQGRGTSAPLPPKVDTKPELTGKIFNTFSPFPTQNALTPPPSA